MRMLLVAVLLAQFLPDPHDDIVVPAPIELPDSPTFIEV